MVVLLHLLDDDQLAPAFTFRAVQGAGDAHHTAKIANHSNDQPAEVGALLTGFCVETWGAVLSL